MGCDVAYTNWQAEEAALACDRFLGKKASEAARASDGTPVYGTLTFSVISRSGDQPGAFPFERSADLSLSVESLPTELTPSFQVKTLVLVSPEGAISECSAPDVEAPADFVAVACEQLKLLQPPIRRDDAGIAISYITDLAVEFSVDRAIQP